MKKFLYIAVFVATIANSATLLKHDIIDNGSNIELKLSFDSAFSGEISQENSTDSIKFILEDVITNSKFTNQISSPIISDIVIENAGANTKITVKGSKNLTPSASISDGGLSLNINFSDSRLNSLSLTTDKKIEEISSKNKGAEGVLKLFFWIIVLALLVGIAYTIFKIVKKERRNIEFDFFEEEDIEADVSDNIKNEAKQSVSNSDLNILYNEKISDDREVVLINKSGKIYLSFLSLENEIPADIYKEMINNKDKFSEFVEICKNSSK
ncbi:MAG: hypothetical protein GXZ15_06000 [Campylobacter sp.]|nr:hypothetical protein [Campylobacter sp.]